jgi:heterogeneous nuclear ribonucleoprotein A1/A3
VKEETAMLSKIITLAAVAALAALLMPSRLEAWGAAHVGYTHVGPGGVYHTGRTVAAGPGGVYAGGRTGAYGAYGGAYRAGYAGGVGYGGAYGARYGAVGYGGGYYGGGAAYGGARYGYIR